MTVRSLLLCSRPPWPRIGGDRVRTWHMARSLATLGPVGVVALAGPDDDERAIRAGLPFAERLWLPRLSRPRAALRSLAALAGGWALQVALYDAPEAAAATREAIDLLQPDVVVAHLVRTVAWAPEGCPPLVADIQDALALHYARARGHGRGWRRLAMTVERGRMGRDVLLVV